MASEKLILNRVMPFTAAALKFFGITISGGTCFNRFLFRPVILLIFASFIFVLAANMILNFKSGHFLVDIAMIVFMVGQALCFYSVENNKFRAQRLILSAVQDLNMTQMQEIQKREKRTIILLFGHSVIQVVSNYCYIWAHGCQEINLLIWGIKNESVVVAIATTSVLFYGYASMAIMITFYVTVQSVIVAHAEHCIRTSHKVKKWFKLLDLTNQRANSIKSSIQFHSEFIEFVNDSLGLIPFTYMAGSFGFWVGGFSFIMANQGIAFSPFFILVEVGMPWMAFAYCGINFSEICGTAVHYIEKVKDEATGIVSEISSTKENKAMTELREKKRALTAFLLRQKPTVITAWNMFEINKSLVLTFCNAVIPFTVMVATTMGQFKDAPPTIPVNNTVP